MSETVAAPADGPARVAVDPWIPCLLAWLAPGLGHVYLGRRTRGVVFFIVVFLTLGLGILSDGAASLIDPHQPLTYLATFDNLAVGPLDLLSRYATYHRIVYRLPEDEAHPLRLELTDLLRRKVRSVTFEYGNTFLLTAGLMNILLILDAFDIAAGRKD